MEEETRKALSKIDLFASLGEEEFEEVEGRVALRSYKRGMVILREEDTNDYMYVVIKGEVKATRMGEDGRETILALRSAGRSFGELTLIDGLTEPATVVATEDSVVALISKSELFEMIYTNRRILNNFLKILSANFRHAVKMIEMLNFRDAERRIRLLFRSLAEERGEAGAGGQVTLRVKLTHQSMAEMTGLTRETVSRVIERLRKEGELEVGEDRSYRLSPGFFEETPLL